MNLPLALAACAVVLSASGCDFFRELESLPGAEGTSTTGDTGLPDGTSGDTGGECTVADEYCSDQDRMLVCNPVSLALDEADCTKLCGTNLNVSCVAMANGQRACWCTQPGKQKAISCSGLEQCLLQCGDAWTGECGQRCFGRTTEATIRLFGALLYCAERTCREPCRNDPETCADCLEAARAGHYDCGLPRGLCDQDDDDIPDAPGP